MSDRALVWFRLDLRVRDNPALSKAIEECREVVPLFLWSPDEEEGWAPGGASKWWLHHSLEALSHDLKKLNLNLVIRRADAALSAIPRIVGELSITKAYWGRRYEPLIIARDTALKSALLEKGVEVQTFKSALLFEPWEIKTKTGGPYQVYTPFMKTCLAAESPRQPLPVPPSTARTPPVKTLKLEELELLPSIDWADGIRGAWTPGSSGGMANLATFLKVSVGNYSETRNIPSTSGTSRLSPYLHFGEMSPHEVWHAVCDELGGIKGLESRHPDARIYLQEILWREFGYHLLFHFPATTDQPLRPVFEHFPWEEDATLLSAWQRGITGYPIVDAGMRELWQTGWMHNRVRMIVASFLVKNLLISWQSGAKWFWDTLVDADLASNTLGWQWSAGCGADAAPYFRVFNPVLQGEKFDSNGTYVKKFVPELEQVPAKYIHKPWTAPESVLNKAGIQLGREYPRPIVDLTESRDSALKAYATLKVFRVAEGT